VSHQRVGLNNLGKPKLVKAESTVPLEEAAKQILQDTTNTPDHQSATPAAPNVSFGSKEDQHLLTETSEQASLSVRDKEHLIQKMFRLPLSVVEELERFKDLKRYGTMTDIVLRGLRPELERIRRLEAKKRT
jgi:hypothetical protein